MFYVEMGCEGTSIETERKRTMLVVVVSSNRPSLTYSLSVSVCVCLQGLQFNQSVNGIYIVNGMFAGRVFFVVCLCRFLAHYIGDGNGGDHLLKFFLFAFMVF